MLYEKESDKFFLPASNMKLITTAGALAILKPEFRYRTSILTNGKMKGDTLIGDILLSTNGDPTLTSETLSLLARGLKLKGINHITGALLFNDTYFDTIPYGKGWMWDDLQYGFSAPISALSVNRNTCRIYVRPGRKIGDAPIVNIEPETGFILIRNKAITGEKSNLSVQRVFENGKNIIIVKGIYPLNAKTKIFIRSVEKPYLYTISLFAEKLKGNGIEIGKKIERGASPQFQDTLIKYPSEPLIKLLYDMDKESSNFTAEVLLKTIGAEKRGLPGTTEKGIQSIEKLMKEKGIIKEKFLQKDGSGLSRYNLISPHQITSLLFYLYRRFEYAPEFLTVLPTSGIDGTLQNRIITPSTQRRVRAKTGTMTGVSTLSGYCITERGKVLIFSIMMKDYIASPTYIRNIQDKILKILIKNF